MLWVWLIIIYVVLVMLLQYSGAIVHVSLIYGKPASKARRKNKRKHAGKSNGFRNYRAGGSGYMAGKGHKRW